MKEKLAPVAEKIKEFFGKLSKRTKMLLVTVAAVALLLALVVVVWVNSRPYAPLFTNLTAGDLSAIVSYLETNQVTDYKIQNDSVLVRQDQEARLKAALIMAGYPKSGFGYGTYLGNVGALSTDADRQAALRFDLQDRLGAVIRCMEGVKDANVTIAMGTDRSYILDSANIVKASATVMVIMQDGQKLSTQQATAIRNLVSKGVSGLEMGEITITDSQGNSYSGDTVFGSIGDASALKLSLEEAANNKARTAIMEQLVLLYGADNVRVAVNTTVDVNRRVGEYTKYATQPGGIIGSEVYNQEIIRGADAAVGGVVGTGTNSQIPEYVENEMTVQGDETYIGNSGEKNNKVDESVEQVEYLAGTISDMTVAVTINSTTAGSVDVAPLKEHIGAAVGLALDQREDKISVLSQAFYSETTAPTPDSGLLQLPQWAVYAAIAGGALFLLLLIFIIILRRKGRKKKAKRMMEEAALAYMPGIQEPQGADIMEVRTEKSMELRKEIRSFAEANPEIAAQLVKGWLRGGDDNYGG